MRNQHGGSGFQNGTRVTPSCISTDKMDTMRGQGMVVEAAQGGGDSHEALTGSVGAYLLRLQ